MYNQKHPIFANRSVMIFFFRLKKELSKCAAVFVIKTENEILNIDPR